MKNAKMINATSLKVNFRNARFFVSCTPLTDNCVVQTSNVPVSKMLSDNGDVPAILALSSRKTNARVQQGNGNRPKLEYSRNAREQPFVDEYIARRGGDETEPRNVFLSLIMADQTNTR